MWFTADTHFGHANSIEFCQRPFKDVEEMDEAMIDRWNTMVGKKDLVWHLGDFAYGSGSTVDKYAKRLNGVIKVCVGNHDNRNHLERNFPDRVFDTKLVRHNGEKIWLSHYAHRVWPDSHHGSFHLYGHSHGGLDEKYGLWGRSMDVGVDRWDFAPVHLDMVIEYLKHEEYTLHHPEL